MKFDLVMVPSAPKPTEAFPSLVTAVADRRAHLDAAHRSFREALKKARAERNK